MPCKAVWHALRWLLLPEDIPKVRSFSLFENTHRSSLVAFTFPYNRFPELHALHIQQQRSKRFAVSRVDLSVLEQVMSSLCPADAPASLCLQSASSPFPTLFAPLLCIAEAAVLSVCCNLGSTQRNFCRRPVQR